jgi:hypothetical protein
MHNSSISLHSEAQEIRLALSTHSAPLEPASSMNSSHRPPSPHLPLQPPPQQPMGATGATRNKQAATLSNMGNDDSRMQDDEEAKGQGPSTTGADQSLSPLQQLKALFNKLDMESKQRRWIPTGRAHYNDQQGIQSTNDPFSADSGSGGAPIEPTGQATVGQRSVRQSSDALFGRANCLVLDTKLLSTDQQTAVEALAASAGRRDKRVEIASVVRAFPTLAAAAPVAVMLQAGRLHICSLPLRPSLRLCAAVCWRPARGRSNRTAATARDTTHWKCSPSLAIRQAALICLTVLN